MKQFCSNCWQNPPVTATVHYFHHYHFHYHYKMDLYCLKIILTITRCNMIPCLFQLNFVFLLPAYIFSLVLFEAFRFLRLVKGLRILFTTIRHILDVLFILIIYIYSYLHSLYFLIYTNLLILIYTYLSILYLYTIT